MFPSNNENPFPYPSTETLLNNYPHQTPSSTLHDDQEPPFLLHFPSPFLDDESPLSQVFSQPHHGTRDVAGDHQTGRGKTKKGGTKMARGMTGKKDRHSKICTARGVRDRRMRLSLQIARKFFDLQDMLGFDKASKTIEWLFSKSKKAIKELMRTENMNPNFSSSDEYEVGSIMEENSNNNEPIMAKKEPRQEARARARETTKEKTKKMINSSHFHESNPSSLEQFGSSSNSPFLEESCYQEIRSNNNATLGFENQFASSVGVMENYLGYHQDNVESAHTGNSASFWVVDCGKRQDNVQTARTGSSVGSWAVDYGKGQDNVETSRTCGSVGSWMVDCGKGRDNVETVRTGNSVGSWVVDYGKGRDNVETAHTSRSVGSWVSDSGQEQDNVESFMGFLGDWNLGGGSAGISPYTDGLAPFAGINPSALYFGGTSFQFLQPLDQEKQFSFNQYSLG